MTSTYGKVAIVAALLLAIIGVVQLKQPQEATTQQAITATQNTKASSPQPVASPSATPTRSTAASALEKPSTVANSRIPKAAAVPKYAPAIRKAPMASTPAKTATALPRLLELGSDSCRPCQMMQPVLAALRADYAGKLQVDFIDVWKDQSAGEKYGVQAIPTQIFFDAAGKELFRHTGYYPREDIIAKFKECGISL